MFAATHQAGYSLRWIDRAVVLCPTRHKIGHFGDVSPSNLLAWYGKQTKPNTTKARIRQSKENVLQVHRINTKKLKPGFVAFYDILSGNGVGVFSKEKISKGGNK